MFLSTHDKLWKQQEIPVLDKVAPCTALRQVVNFGVVCYEVLSRSMWRDESNCIRMTLNKCCQKWLHKSTYKVFTFNKFWWEQRTVTLVWWICQSLETSLEGYLFFARHVKCSPYHPETNAETEIGLDQKLLLGLNLAQTTGHKSCEWFFRLHAVCIAKNLMLRLL